MTEIDRLRRVLRDFPTYARKFLRIRTKAGELVSFRLNPVQKKLHDVWEQQMADGKPVRIIVLKARREGISTYVQGRFFHFASTKKNRHAKVVAHDAEGSDTLFEMSRIFYDQMPSHVVLSDGTEVQIRPEKEYSNKKEISYYDTLSKLTVTTAGKGAGETTARKGSGKGRSQTVHFLHLSEFAFWNDQKNTFVALSQTVPNLPDTVIVIESTANGIGDEFHRMWEAAKRGENDYIPVFLAWWEHDEYRLPLAPGETLEPYDAEEKELIKRFNLTAEQLKWRRHTLRNECAGDLDQFHQEYPADDQEAFLVSGRPFFNTKALARIKAEDIRPPKAVGNLDKDGKFVEHPKGYLSIWEYPIADHCYAIGGDVAEGLETGDYCVLEVMDRNKMEQVAEWRGHYDPDLLGVEAVKLAKFYNRAVIGIESNNHGLTTNKAILREKYYRVYQQEVVDEINPDRTEKIGWRTDTKTRPLMLDEMEKSLRDGILTIRSETLISECFSFVRNAKGKPEAQAGCHDDTVMAMAIAIQMHQQMPMLGVISEAERARRRRQREKLTQPGVSDITGY